MVFGKYGPGSLEGYPDEKYEAIMEDPVGAAVGALTRALGEALDSLGRTVVNGLKAVADWVGEYIIKPLAGFASAIFEGIKNLVSSGVNTLLDSLVSIAGETFPVDVARPLGIIAAVAGTFIGVTAAIKMIDALHPFRSIVGESSLALMYAFMGYEIFTGAFWRPVMGSAVEAPMRYWAQDKFRPFLVGHQDADDMLFEGAIDQEEWRQIHRWAGWRESWIVAHYDTMDREPSVMDLVRIADNVQLDPNWARAQLGQANFRQAEIEQIMRALERRPVMDEVRIVRQQLLYDVRDGYMSEEDLVQELNRLGHQSAEVKLLVQAARVMRSKAFAKARRDVLVEAYRRDLIVDEDLVDGLLELGMSQDLAGATIALERLRKVPKPKRERLSV